LRKVDVLDVVPRLVQGSAVHERDGPQMGRQEGEVVGRQRGQEAIGLRIELAKAGRRYGEGHGPLSARKTVRFASPPERACVTDEHHFSRKFRPRLRGQLQCI
jgi:hypothetical protein